MIQTSELEPEAEKFLRDGKYDTPQYQSLIFGYSAAVSLKRIANSLEKLHLTEDDLHYLKKKV